MRGGCSFGRLQGLYIPPISLKRIKNKKSVLTNRNRSFERMVHELNQLELTLKDPIFLTESLTITIIVLPEVDFLLLMKTFET